MHTFAVPTLAFVLSSTPALASKTWWTLGFAQGVDCTGTGTGLTTGPGQYNHETVCVPVPDYGFTSAVSWSVTPSSERSFTMGLHTTNDCSGDGGKYVGRHNPECIDLGRTKSISVTRHPKKRSVTGRRSAEAFLDDHVQGQEEESTDANALQTEAESGPKNNSNKLEQRNSCYTPNFALGAGVAAGMFIYNAAGTCPATAKPEDAHNGQCGISAVFGVATSLATAYAIQGLIRHGDQSKRDIAILQNDSTLIDGLSISYTPVHEASIVHPVPLGDEWSHYRIDYHDLRGERANGSAIHSVHASGKQRIAASVKEDGDDTGLVTRKAPATAYYSWVDMNREWYRTQACHDTHSADSMAVQLWNYLKHQNRDEACADMEVRGLEINRGAVALIRGDYTDHSDLC